MLHNFAYPPPHLPYPPLPQPNVPLSLVNSNTFTIIPKYYYSEIRV